MCHYYRPRNKVELVRFLVGYDVDRQRVYLRLRYKQLWGMYYKKVRDYEKREYGSDREIIQTLNTKAYV